MFLKFMNIEILGKLKNISWLTHVDCKNEHQNDLRLLIKVRGKMFRRKLRRKFWFWSTRIRY